MLKLIQSNDMLKLLNLLNVAKILLPDMFFHDCLQLSQGTPITSLAPSH